MKKLLDRFFDSNTLVYIGGELPPHYVPSEEAPLIPKVMHLIFWRIIVPFRRNVLLECDYCRKLSRGFPCVVRKIEGFYHELGYYEGFSRRLHKRCAEKWREYEVRSHSGPTDVCIDCKRGFYLCNKMGEDCPVKGMARNHRVKGEEDFIMI